MLKSTRYIVQSNQLRSFVKSFSASTTGTVSTEKTGIVLLERPQPGIAHIILNRHEGKNSLCRALVNDVGVLLFLLINLYIYVDVMFFI